MTLFQCIGLLLRAATPEYLIEAQAFGFVGGQSGGGDFDLVGVMARTAAAGRLLGGEFEFEPTESSRLPTLSMGIPIRIELVSDGVLLSWPESGAAGFLLEESSSLRSGPTAAEWRPAGVQPQSAGGWTVVHLPAAIEARFFRLRRP